MNTTAYFDTRTQFFKEVFARGFDFERYVQTGSEAQCKRWLDYANSVELTDTQKNLIAGFTRKMNILVLTGIWCGDCVRQGPMLRAIEQASSSITVRFVDNKKEAELQRELRINGAEKVPVVVILSEDFFEVSRFGDRTLSVYRRKAAVELGPACESGVKGIDTFALQAEIQEWVDQVERAQLVLRLAPLLRKRYND